MATERLVASTSRGDQSCYPFPLIPHLTLDILGYLPLRTVISLERVNREVASIIHLYLESKRSLCLANFPDRRKGLTFHTVDSLVAQLFAIMVCSLLSCLSYSYMSYIQPNDVLGSAWNRIWKEDYEEERIPNYAAFTKIFSLCHKLTSLELQNIDMKLFSMIDSQLVCLQNLCIHEVETDVTPQAIQSLDNLGKSIRILAWGVAIPYNVIFSLVKKFSNLHRLIAVSCVDDIRKPHGYGVDIDFDLIQAGKNLQHVHCGIRELIIDSSRVDNYVDPIRIGKRNLETFEAHNIRCHYMSSLVKIFNEMKNPLETVCLGLSSIEQDVDDSEHPLEDLLTTQSFISVKDLRLELPEHYTLSSENIDTYFRKVNKELKCLKLSSSSSKTKSGNYFCDRNGIEKFIRMFPALEELCIHPLRLVGKWKDENKNERGEEGRFDENDFVNEREALNFCSQVSQLPNLKSLHLPSGNFDEIIAKELSSVYEMVFIKNKSAEVIRAHQRKRARRSSSQVDAKSSDDEEQVDELEEEIIPGFRDRDIRRAKLRSPYCSCVFSSQTHRRRFKSDNRNLF